MNEAIAVNRPPEPDWLSVTDEELFAYREAENRARASVEARALLGEPDPGALIAWQEIALPGRDLPVRVHRPASSGNAADRTALPLVLHVHGGGFVGTAVQCDWVTSHVAAQLPAVVVSVEHRLLAPDTPMSAAVDDGWDTLRHIVEHATEWGIDPARTAVFGESGGGLICAMAAIRAREAGLGLRAQVLVNPAVDVTETMLDYHSATEYAKTPTLSLPVLQLVRRLAAPSGADARAVSPVYADNLGGLPPTLVVVPTDDPIADHGRRYAERLQAAGTSARLSEYPATGHGFLSVPGLAAQAEPARAEITEHLRAALTS
ncbi:alpha/beta hydrolase [Streptomyces sp. A7024]|uniref:Alpha/beta hydrolase n=1 Tax=Streptomyces coryli TaxID=1128680 RepID=A0A6G4TTK5_9ACTN|nr:alpha/beta hydrolase [Streptomyces coryli]NGN62357.1 alpha/beta hydrolase [Streptomyces coryli]